jgi:type I restriction enzyme S subunit
MGSRAETKTGGRPATTGVIRGDYALSVGNPGTPLPEGWRWTALTDVARLETGHTPSRKHPEYWGGNVPWVGIKDATSNHGRVIEDTYQHTNDLGIANSSARILPKHTVCLSRTASVGYVIVIGRPMATSQDFVNWVCSETIDWRFLKYVLLAEREAFLRFASGTTHQTIYFPEVKAFHVALPPIEEQRTIAHILGTLDDKIELNRRMNETLEAMARALFKSWFVDFDPVRAKTERRDPGLPKPLADLFPDSFEDSELGEIPKGWLLRTIEELSERVAMGPFGSSIKVETFVSQGIPVISGQHLRGTMLDDSDFNFITHEHADQLQRCNVQRGDVVFTHAGSIGQVAFIPGTSRYDRYVISQRQFYLRCDPKKMSAMFIVLYFKTPEGQHRLLANTSSTGVPSISQPVSYLRQLKIVVPPKILLQTFDSVARSIYLRVAANTKESRTLAALRVTLLPKLISGEVHVGEIAKAAIA